MLPVAGVLFFGAPWILRRVRRGLRGRGHPAAALVRRRRGAPGRHGDVLRGAARAEPYLRTRLAAGPVVRPGARSDAAAAAPHGADRSGRRRDLLARGDRRDRRAQAVPDAPARTGRRGPRGRGSRRRPRRPRGARGTGRRPRPARPRLGARPGHPRAGHPRRLRPPGTPSRRTPWSRYPAHRHTCTGRDARPADLGAAEAARPGAAGRGAGAGLRVVRRAVRGGGGGRAVRGGLRRRARRSTYRRSPPYRRRRHSPRSRRQPLSLRGSGCNPPGSVCSSAACWPSRCSCTGCRRRAWARPTWTGWAGSG